MEEYIIDLKVVDSPLLDKKDWEERPHKYDVKHRKV